MPLIPTVGRLMVHVRDIPENYVTLSDHFSVVVAQMAPSAERPRLIFSSMVEPHPGVFIAETVSYAVAGIWNDPDSLCCPIVSDKPYPAGSRTLRLIQFLRDEVPSRPPTLVWTIVVEDEDLIVSGPIDVEIHPPVRVVIVVVRTLKTLTVESSLNPTILAEIPNLVEVVRSNS